MQIWKNQESKKGTETLNDLDDEDFVINYSEETRVPVIAQDPIRNIPKDIPTDEAET